LALEQGLNPRVIFGGLEAALKRLSSTLVQASVMFARNSLRGECQQDISGHCVVVAGVHIDHAAKDGWAGAVQSSAMRFHTVGGMKVPDSVKFPQHRAVAGVVRAEVSIERTGEQHPRNQRGWGHLCGAASDLP